MFRQFRHDAEQRFGKIFGSESEVICKEDGFCQGRVHLMPAVEFFLECSYLRKGFKRFIPVVEMADKREKVRSALNRLKVIESFAEWRHIGHKRGRLEFIAYVVAILVEIIFMQKFS